MGKVIFLLEEPSMEALLEDMLPRFFPDVAFQYVPHEGKQDLERSIPRKLRAWKEPGVRFVVLRDNDGNDCKVLKERLRLLCERGGRQDSLVRIVCQELEAWYFGEPEALAEAYDRPSLQHIGRKRGFREPDTIQKPSERLQKIVPEFQKKSGARRMAQHLSKERNKSASFHALLDGIEVLLGSTKKDLQERQFQMTLGELDTGC